MADDLLLQSAAPATPAAGISAATDEVTATPGTHIGLGKLCVSANGDRTPIPADAANGLDVDVTRLPALPAGANTIGKVDQGAAGAAAWPVADALADTALGAPADAEAAGNGSVIAILKRLRTLLAGTLVVSNAASSQADGHSVTIGAQTDAAAGSDAGTFSLIALFKRLLQKLTTGIPITGTVTVDTELPAAAALADATPNPSAPSLGAQNELFNGATWDRMRGDIANGLDVDVTRLPALPAGTANIGDVDVVTQVGAANLANNQVVVDTTAGGVTVAASRATRRSITIVNHGTIDVYVGQGTVSAANGLLLRGIPGAALTLRVSAAVKAIAASASVTVSYIEEYD